MHNKIIMIDTDGGIITFKSRTEFKNFLQNRVNEAQQWGDPAPDFDDIQVYVGQELEIDFRTKLKIKPSDEFEQADLWESVPKEERVVL